MIVKPIYSVLSILEDKEKHQSYFYSTCEREDQKNLFFGETLSSFAYTELVKPHNEN